MLSVDGSADAAATAKIWSGWSKFRQLSFLTENGFPGVQLLYMGSEAYHHPLSSPFTTNRRFFLFSSDFSYLPSSQVAW